VTLRVVVLDDEPTLYAGPHDDDLLQLQPVAELTLYTVRPADRTEFLQRLAPALRLLPAAAGRWLGRAARGALSGGPVAP